MTTAPRYQCPCCDYPTLAEPSTPEICVLCDWAYGQGQPDAFGESYILSEAQSNFASYLTCHRLDDVPGIGIEMHPEILAAKQSLMAAFETQGSIASVEAAIKYLHSVRQFETAFACEESWDLVMAVCDLIVERVADRPEPDMLSPIEMTLLRAVTFDEQVCNGGFHQFFFNSTGDFTAETLAALKAMGLLKSAELLNQAMGIFPNHRPPTDQSDRVRFLKNLDDDTLGALSDLGAAYYAQDEKPATVAAEFCRKHKADFK